MPKLKKPKIIVLILEALSCIDLNYRVATVSKMYLIAKERDMLGSLNEIEWTVLKCIKAIISRNKCI